MPPRKNAVPYRHQPKGCSDSTDETELFPGAMLQLANLVPAPDTLNHWVPRPGMSLLAGTAAMANGFVSASIQVGDYWFGMVAGASSKDYPICYNVRTNTVVAVTGANASNTPLSQPTTGTWTPPHMELVGIYVIVTSPGFGATLFGAINIATITAPVWTSQTTATNALPCTPIWVGQFFDRAYFVCNPVGGQPAVIATDALGPLTRTNATYILTFNDNVPIVATGPLGLNNQVIGGQVQSLIVFKANLTLFQVTGDFSLTGSMGTQVNALNVATGTYAANSITQTPEGLSFVAPDGLRNIGFNADVSPPIGSAGTGITIPFANSSVPSRINSSCNATSIRVTTINGAAGGSPKQEWVYDLPRKVWHGPHTSWFDQIQSYGNTFVVYRSDQVGLFQSDIMPSSSSTYTEFGGAINCVYQTAMLPERQDLRQCAMCESLFYEGHGTAVTYNVSALNQNGSVIEFISVASLGAVTSWDAFTWGSAPWLGQQQTLAARQIPWTAPVVFDRMSIQISFQAAAGGRIGDLYMVYQLLGYTAIA